MHVIAEPESVPSAAYILVSLNGLGEIPKRSCASTHCEWPKEVASLIFGLAYI